MRFLKQYIASVFLSCVIIVAFFFFVFNTSWFLAMDQTWYQAITRHRLEGLVFLFSRITLLGKWYVVIGLAAIVLIVLHKKHAKQYIVPLLLAILGSSTAAAILKIVLQRHRPMNSVSLESSFSFPSGHATIAMAFYGFLAWFLLKKQKKQFVRGFILILALVLIMLIGFSRLYLGVHYLSDILGGYLLGLIFLGFCVYKYRAK